MLYSSAREADPSPGGVDSRPVVSGLPREAVGIGLRPALYAELDALRPPIGYLEIIAENYLGASGVPRAQLRKLARHYPVVAHGVSLNLLGAEPLDLDYLSRLKALVQEFSIPFVSDHLCWCAHGGSHTHDLLPAPYEPELVGYVAERALHVQEFLGVPFGIENLSSYITFERDRMPEWEFYRAVVEQSGCFYMLDINNIYVSSVNHGFSAKTYLDSVLWDRVLQVHLAGHQRLQTGLLHDTHDREVAEEVLELYRAAWRLGGPFPTLVEWDADIPSLGVVVKQLSRAVRAREENG